ncbi:MAG TPA: enoyl-CoA hydratase/isomerase family protein [Dehalococcoidia bacterium]|jgi:2-(1,2-epoxy-1,2-dihydrophenyl)acetyl-CoA isomerase|nr:enoyl-CoA hydratase/isomerase family protein [Dehalococcoidia bacterium]
MAYQTLLDERRGEGGIQWITLNRPEKLNAISGTMFRELKEIFERSRRDRTVRCIVITGAGRAFCAGADFSGSDPIAAHDPQPAQFPEDPNDLEGSRLRFRVESDAFIALRRLEVPVVACVNGVAVGAGFDMVCACDMAVVSTAARFQVAYVKRGYFADLGGFQTIPRAIGWRKAMEMMMTGNFMSAEELHRYGLSNYLVEPDQLEERTMQLARDLEAGPPLAQKLGKTLAYRLADKDFETALEMSGIALQVITPSHDRIEGGRSFREKREPKFLGR